MRVKVDWFVVDGEIVLCLSWMKSEVDSSGVVGETSEDNSRSLKGDM